MILNIFTGGKGGIGKTLCALCSSVYYLSEVKNSHVNVYDMNSNNTDLFKILYGKPLAPSTSSTSGFIIKDIGRNIAESKIICRKKMYELQTNLDIWKAIGTVVDLSENCNNLIIDTNVNTASLLYFENVETAASVSDIISSSKISKIRIWLVWSFNILSDIAKNDRLMYEESIKSFDEISKGKFSERIDFIHILNPYKFFREDQFGSVTSLINNISDALANVIPVVNENEVNVMGEHGITFNKMVTHFVTAFKKNPKNLPGAYKDLIDAIKESSRRLPFNVCFIPFYIKKPIVQNYIENLSADPPLGDLKSLIKPVDRIYESLRRFISSYEDKARG